VTVNVTAVFIGDTFLTSPRVFVADDLQIVLCMLVNSYHFYVKTQTLQKCAHSMQWKVTGKVENSVHKH